MSRDRIVRSRIPSAIASLAVGVGAFIAAAAPVQANSILQDFNLIVLGDLIDVTEVEGRAYVGGDLLARSSNYGFKLMQADYDHNPATLVVGGSIHPTTKNKEHYKVHGDFYYNGTTLNQNNEDVIGYHSFGGSQQPNTYSLNAVRDTVTQYSSYLQGLSDTHVASIPTIGPGPAKLDATGATGIVVFSVDGNALLNNSYVQQIELLVGADVEHIVINVSGTDIKFHYGNFVGAIQNSDILSLVTWNFFEAENLYFDRTVYGAILAPYATLETNQTMVGSMVVENLNSQSEVHLPITPPLDIPPTDTPVVPLPAAAWGGLALLGMAGGRQVMRRRG